MIADESFGHVAITSLIQFGFVVVLGGLVGAVFARVRKQRELDLEARRQFNELYGAWFAVWKAWEAALDRVNQIGADVPSHEVMELCDRATQIEAGVESLIVRLVTQIRLDGMQIARLSRFREGFQALRESLERSEPLAWRVQGSEDLVDPYVTFKLFAAELAQLLSSPGLASLWRRAPALAEAQTALIEVTSFRTDDKHTWWKDEGKASAHQTSLDALARVRSRHYGD